ncbi:MAG: aminotransferase class I/II-fold pyridoxal phosphate-dependent enzyme [Actinomycetota bacterium]|nr:aminotransferase class I/II-fold pyridoxal phosphate-dependent enzyme [Actinomycetota bacterium]
MELPPFRIEQYFARHEFNTQHLLSASDCEPLGVGELVQLEPDAAERLLALRCGYSEPAGSGELREAIAALYHGLSAEQIVVTTCAEEAIFLVLHAVLGPGDHAIVATPCYESALQLARSTGAEVSEWRRRFEDGWAHDLEALAGLLRPQTKLVYLNEPHNPTGTLIDQWSFQRLVERCIEHEVLIFSDEVYRGLEHNPADRLPAICELSPSSVSLGSVTKSLGLAGLRTGWIATTDAALRQRVVDLKYYTTICASSPSEQLTALALRHAPELIARNLELINDNVMLVEEFFAEHPDRFEWVRPTAGAIGFPRVHGIADVERWCEGLAAAGVLVLPGSVYDEPRHVRMGFGRAGVQDALAVLGAQLEDLDAEG